MHFLPGCAPRSACMTCCGSRVLSTCPAAIAGRSCRRSATGCNNISTGLGIAGEKRETRLVVIGRKGLDRVAITAALSG